MSFKLLFIGYFECYIFVIVILVCYFLCVVGLYFNKFGIFVIDFMFIFFIFRDKVLWGF